MSRFEAVVVEWQDLLHYVALIRTRQFEPYGVSVQLHFASEVVLEVVIVDAEFDVEKRCKVRSMKVTGTMHESHRRDRTIFKIGVIVSGCRGNCCCEVTFESV